VTHDPEDLTGELMKFEELAAPLIVDAPPPREEILSKVGFCRALLLREEDFFL